MHPSVHPIYSPWPLQNPLSFGLPRRHGRWESRGESEEDQIAQNVRNPKTTPRFFFCIMYNVLVFTFKFFLVSYVMSNGYKPAPLELGHVKLTPNQNQLVEKLAENGHNVWARDRVRQGWTYSIVQVDVDTVLTLP